MSLPWLRMASMQLGVHRCICSYAWVCVVILYNHTCRGLFDSRSGYYMASVTAGTLNILCYRQLDQALAAYE